MKAQNSLTTDYEDLNIVKQYALYPLVHQVVGRPEFLRFVGAVAGKRILDFGCGNGHITQALKRRGAKCIGVDPSTSFINEAKSKYPNLDFRIIKKSKLAGIQSSCFDKVILSLVLPSVDNKRELKALFREACRVLRKDGELIFSTLHPLMVRNLNDGIRNVRIPSTMHYFSTGAKFQNDVMLPDKTFMTFTNSQWTLEDISNELIANNFVILAIKEPKVSKNKYWPLLKDILITPFYIFIKAKKLSSKSNRIELEKI